MLSTKKILTLLLLSLLVLIFSACPVTYPGDGTVRFEGTNNSSSFDVEEIIITFTNSSTSEEYSSTVYFGSVGTSLSSFSQVEPGNYSLNIAINFTDGTAAVNNSSDFSLTDGEIKSIEYTLEEDGSSPRVEFGYIESEGGTYLDLDALGAGVISKWDVDGSTLSVYQSLLAYGYLENFDKIEAEYPDGSFVSFGESRGFSDINVFYSLGDYSQTYVGFNRPDYTDTGIYSLTIHDSLGGSVGDDIYIDPSWADDGSNIAKITTDFTTGFIDVTSLSIDYQIDSDDDINFIAILVTDSDQYLVDYLKIDSPYPVGAGGSEILTLSSDPLYYNYVLTIITADKEIEDSFFSNLDQVSPDSLPLELLLYTNDDGYSPTQIGYQVKSVIIDNTGL